MPTVDELNKQIQDQRTKHLQNSGKPTTTKWNGRNPVGLSSGFDSRGHKTSGGVANSN